jgi:hypothetical protein
MKTVLRVDNPRPPRGCAGKLDCRFYSFAAAASEVNFPESCTCQFAQPLRQFTREFRHVALQHCRTTPVQFVFQRLNNVRMAVPRVVNAVPRQEVEDSSCVPGKKLCSRAAFIPDIQSQQVQQRHPLRVDVFLVGRFD